MAIKKLLLAGAIVAGLAGAGLVGALVGGTSVSYAEEATDEAATDDESGRGLGPGDGGGRGPGHGGPPPFEVVAETFGITEDELRTELEVGESITSVAEANDVDIQSVIDALVEDATADIQERVDAGDLTADEAAERTAELPDRIAEFVSREGLSARGDC